MARPPSAGPLGAPAYSGPSQQYELVGATTPTGISLPGAAFPKGWNARYLAKTVTSGTGRIVVGVLGDSIMAGAFASNLMPTAAGTSAPMLLGAYLRALYGDGGSGFVSCALGGPNYTTGYTNWPDLGATAPGGRNDGEAWGENFSQRNGVGIANSVTEAADPGMTFTFYARGTDIYVYYYDDPDRNAPFTVAIDGGAAVTAPRGGAKGTLEYHVSATDAEHTVVITSGGGGYVDICGVAGLRPTGAVLHNFSMPGGTGQGLYGMNSYDGGQVEDQQTFIAQYPCVWDMTGGSAFAALQCDALILAAIVNDTADGVTPDATPVGFANALAQFVNNARADWLEPALPQTLLFLAPNLGNPATFWFHTTTGASQQNRANAAAIMAAQGGAFVDAQVLWPPYSATVPAGYWALSDGYGNYGPVAPMGDSGTTYTTANAIHPSDVGHASLFAIMRDALNTRV